jgi:uncharacterized protein (DUF433 family)
MPTTSSPSVNSQSVGGVIGSDGADMSAAPGNANGQYALYGGRDPRELPMYPLDQAAGFLLLPRSTLKAWVFGATWRPKGEHRTRVFHPLLDPPDRGQQMLSFVNLVEAHVLKAVRRKHFVQMAKVRDAIVDLKKRFETQHPLADVDLLAGGGNLYLQEHEELLNLSMGKQIAMNFLKVYLTRIERELDIGRAIKLFPFVVEPVRIGNQILVGNQAAEHESKIIAIDPYVSFGRPIIDGTGIPTREIADRFWGGDTIAQLKEDFGRTETEIEYALRWETAQAAHT